MPLCERGLHSKKSPRYTMVKIEIVVVEILFFALFSNLKKQSRNLDFTQVFGIDRVIHHTKIQFEINSQLYDIFSKQ